MVQIGKSYITPSGAICQVKSINPNGYAICRGLKTEPSVWFSDDVSKTIDSLEPLDDEVASKIWLLVDQFVSDCKSVQKAYALSK